MERLVDEEGVIARRTYKQIKYVLKVRKPLKEGEVREIPRNLHRAKAAKQKAGEKKMALGDPPARVWSPWTKAARLSSRPDYSLEKKEFMEKFGLFPAYDVVQG